MVVPHQRALDDCLPLERPRQLVALEALEPCPEPHVHQRCVLRLDPADALERTGDGRLRALEQQLPREQCPVQLTLGQDPVTRRCVALRVVLGYEAAMSKIEDPREAGRSRLSRSRSRRRPGSSQDGAAARLWLRLVRGAWTPHRSSRADHRRRQRHRPRGCSRIRPGGRRRLISYLEEHSDAEETVGVVEEAGRKGIAVAGDIGDPEHCRTLVEQAVSDFGRLDILVNNAAFQMEHESITEIPVDEIERVFRTNIFSIFYLCQAAIPHMKPGSSIINTTSIQAYDPSPELLHYAVTKGAIRTFTHLSQELVEKGIRVNAVAPGPVWTPLIAMSFDGEKVSGFGEQTRSSARHSPPSWRPSTSSWPPTSRATSSARSSA